MRIKQPVCITLFQFLVIFAHSMPNFGMNKPHLLFHLGDRIPISLNIGWGYWTEDQTLRLQYQNTNDQLYVNMKAHNGEDMFQQDITDEACHVNSQIKYILNQNQSWQTEINMKNTLNSHEKLRTTWFVYAAVQNNDYRHVDHEKYSTFITLIPEYSKQSLNIQQKTVQNSVQIKVKSALTQKQQTIKIKTDKMNKKPKIFGLSANTSQTYNIRSMVDEFKHLVQINRGQNVTRTSDKKILSWQNSQINLMKTGNFEGKNYVVVLIYGTFEEDANIFMTNSTQAQHFDQQQHESRKTIFDRKLLQASALQTEYHEFTRHVVSNLYGGITYYSGRLYTQNSLTIHSQDFCYSFTPSRLIFPRSFLWDDGFHQAVALNYHPSIVIDILRIWINKIDLFGWIGRQQIRGYQVSAMLPDSTFIFQDWFQMNPPTLMLSIAKLIDLSANNTQISKQFQQLLNGRLGKLESWYKYFKRTQSHETLDYDQTRTTSQIFYRWQCKDQCKKGNFMGSGLDDYPRRMNQTQISKQHVDVISWLYFFADTLNKAALFMKEKGLENTHSQRKINYYARQAQNYKKKLFEQFLDPKDSLFKDIVVENKDIFIQSFVDHRGYVNLFPFFTGMLQPCKFVDQQARIKALKSTLEIMMNQKQLFSEDGLRSLSISDQLYGTDENYWRGAIWMPINYMVLRACKIYYWDEAQVGAEIRTLYESLRNNLIKTVTQNYKESGYLYQNYYKQKGHRGFPFYGWTSLIANIIAENY